MYDMFRYDDKEIKVLLSSMVILIDSREKEVLHIIEGFNSKKIKYEYVKLDFADYSFMIPANEQLGISRDIYFNNEISIERKNSLEELSGNLTRGRDQFENELIRSKGKIVLLIENGSYLEIIYHSYKTQYNEKSYFASLMSFKARYNIDIQFIDSKFTWFLIYNKFYYYLRNYLKS